MFLDGKYFFFATRRANKDHFSVLQRITRTHIQNVYNSPQTCSSDLCRLMHRKTKPFVRMDSMNRKKGEHEQ